MTRQAKRSFFILLIGLILTASVGGCGAGYYEERVREYYDENLRVEEIDDGVYLITASMDGRGAGMAGRAL